MLDLEQIFARTMRTGVESKAIQVPPRYVTLAGEVLGDLQEDDDDDGDAPDDAYQLWLGGSPDQAGRTAYATDIFKMKYDDLEATVEPIFAMYKSQRNAVDEAFGDFCYRVGWPAIKDFSETYQPGDHAKLADPFAPPLLPTPDATAPIDSALLAQVEAAAKARGLDAATLMDMIVREALED